MKWVAGVIAAMAVVGAPTVVHADPAGATDYRTEVVAVRPAAALDVISVEIVGGDAFVAVTVEQGHELVVLGYLPDEEPYLRIRADGVVEHNVRSRATYYNADRYGTAEIPDVVDTAAPPEWERIGGGGSWAWHDHRAHWMGAEPLIGLERGDTLPSDVVPLLVDGERTEVEVVTTYLAAPSPWPSMVGLLVGLSLGLVALWVGRATAVLGLAALGVAALTAGLAQYRSLPPATGPLVTWWLMPALALCATAGVIVTYRRSVWLELGLVAFASIQLVLWGWQRRDHLTAAVVPTSLAPGLDRAITTAVIAGAAVIAIGTAREVWRAVRPGEASFADA